MTLWCGQDGSFNDDAGDGAADLSGLDEEIAVGWQDPFTDWDGNLFDGMGQYGVYTVTDPWEPAEFAAIPYPPPYEAPPPPVEAPHASTQQPPSPLETPAAPASPSTPHFGPPAPGGHGSRQRPGGRANAHSTMARGEMMTGFDVPFTDEDGNLLMDPHPSHRDWMQPMTYGDPVMTGWDTPLTDIEGQLLSGEGQYGQFTMENPYDHRSFNNVNLEAPGLEGDPFYYYTGADDAGQQAGQALGSMFGSAAGEDSKAWGQAGSSIASSIEQGSDSGDWGSAAASIATTVAKVAVPAIVKAATKSSSSSSSSTPSASTPSTTPASTSPQAQANAARAKDPRHQALQKLLGQARQLAQKYGIPIQVARRQAVASRAVAPAATAGDQLQSFMAQMAAQQQGTAQ